LDGELRLLSDQKPDAIDYASPGTPPLMRTSRFASVALMLAVTTSPFGVFTLGMIVGKPIGRFIESSFGFERGFWMILVGLPAVALCISVAALARIERNPRELRGKGMAIGGVVVSLLSGVAGFLLTVTILSAMSC
jgi:hypothetical protein